MTAGGPFGRDLDYDPPLELSREQMVAPPSASINCPCASNGAPRWYCWVAAPDCLHGKPSAEQFRDRLREGRNSSG